MLRIDLNLINETEISLFLFPKWRCHRLFLIPNFQILFLLFINLSSQKYQMLWRSSILSQIKIEMPCENWKISRKTAFAYVFPFRLLLRAFIVIHLHKMSDISDDDKAATKYTAAGTVGISQRRIARKLLLNEWVAVVFCCYARHGQLFLLWNQFAFSKIWFPVFPAVNKLICRRHDCGWTARAKIAGNHTETLRHNDRDLFN